MDLKITADDITEVQAILRRWRTSAMVKKNDKALKEVELIMKVVSALYGG